jgi:Arc/MetJ-type ribon-helix-helix transcriptional regulator
MSHEPRRNNRPDFNEVFRHELGPCKAPAKKPKDTTPDRLRPGHPSRWDDNAQHWAGLWRLELLKEIEGGTKSPPKDLANACEEYARLCFLYGNAGEVIALAKMALRLLGHQPEERKREGLRLINPTYQRVIQLAIGCGFYAEASSFIRYAIELGELIERSTYRLHNAPISRPLPWQAWYLDLADSELKAGRVDDALQALDAGVARCGASDLYGLRIRLEFEAVQIAFHHGKRPEALRRCLEIIDQYDPKAPNQLPLILKAKGLHEEFVTES